MKRSDLSPFRAFTNLFCSILRQLNGASCRYGRSQDNISDSPSDTVSKQGLRGATPLVIAIYLFFTGVPVITYADAWTDYKSKVVNLLNEKNREIGEDYHPKTHMRFIFSLSVRNDGKILRVHLKRRSGDKELDKRALKAIFSLSPLPPPPSVSFLGRLFSPIKHEFNFYPSRLVAEPSKPIKKSHVRSLEVLDVQGRLTQLGYDPGILDGIYGKATMAAIQQYQKDHGLRIDGRVSDNLIEHLENVASRDTSHETRPSVSRNDNANTTTNVTSKVTLADATALSTPSISDDLPEPKPDYCESSGEKFKETAASFIAADEVFGPFVDACKEHDQCYSDAASSINETLGKSSDSSDDVRALFAVEKLSCDGTFFANINQTCLDDPAHALSKKFYPNQIEVGCGRITALYFTAVTSSWGDDAFDRLLSRDVNSSTTSESGEETELRLQPDTTQPQLSGGPYPTSSVDPTGLVQVDKLYCKTDRACVYTYGLENVAKGGKICSGDCVRVLGFSKRNTTNGESPTIILEDVQGDVGYLYRWAFNKGFETQSVLSGVDNSKGIGEPQASQAVAVSDLSDAKLHENTQTETVSDYRRTAFNQEGVVFCKKNHLSQCTLTYGLDNIVEGDKICAGDCIHLIAFEYRQGREIALLRDQHGSDRFIYKWAFDKEFVPQHSSPVKRMSINSSKLDSAKVVSINHGGRGKENEVADAKSKWNSYQNLNEVYEDAFGTTRYTIRANNQLDAEISLSGRQSFGNTSTVGGSYSFINNESIRIAVPFGGSTSVEVYEITSVGLIESKNNGTPKVLYDANHIQTMRCLDLKQNGPGVVTEVLENLKSPDKFESGEEWFDVVVEPKASRNESRQFKTSAARYGNHTLVRIKRSGCDKILVSDSLMTKNPLLVDGQLADSIWENLVTQIQRKKKRISDSKTASKTVREFDIRHLQGRDLTGVGSATLTNVGFSMRTRYNSGYGKPKTFLFYDMYDTDNYWWRGLIKERKNSINQMSAKPSINCRELHHLRSNELLGYIAWSNPFWTSVGPLNLDPYPPVFDILQDCNKFSAESMSTMREWKTKYPDLPVLIDSVVK